MSRDDPPRMLETLSGDDPLRLSIEAGRSEQPSNDALDRMFAAMPAFPPGGPEGSGDPSLDQGGGDPGLSADPGPADLGAPDLTSLGDVGLGAGKVGTSIIPMTSGFAALKTIGIVAALGAATAVGVVATRAPDPTPTTISTTASTEAHAPPFPGPIRSSEPTALQEPEPAPSTSTEPAPESPTIKKTEIELLTEAQQALGGNPAKSLALVQQAASLYPSGSLAQEREMVRIQALLGVGRRDDALAAAQAFATNNPDSAYVRRLEVLFPELAP